MNKRVFYILFAVFFLAQSMVVAREMKFSTAGFYPLENSGREVFNMNNGWRFFKGKVADGQSVALNDKGWEVVSIPHGLEYLPEEASGGINYQGEAWYRKSFDAPKSLKGRKVFLHFEGIMGKSKIWINGTLLCQHFDGYLPAVVDVTDHLSYDKKNVVAVVADNSDDGSYPPGKPQWALDFTYFGGIYRDCYLISHGKTYITDPTMANEIAGGGVFVYTTKVDELESILGVKVHIKNESSRTTKARVCFTLKDNDGNIVASSSQPTSIATGKSTHTTGALTVKNPKLWSPESPYRYDLEISVKDSKAIVIDGMTMKVGIRSVDYKAGKGLYINGKPYVDKLVGVNRHQEFAVIGNAVPNSLHLRDAIKLRDAGVRIVRCTQYPHDPAFLDACDDLGIFVLLPIAGWQYWSDEPIFAERVYAHIRSLVRRDRNHPSLFYWEPVLNETNFPIDYSKKAKQCVDEEFPYNKAWNAIDPGSKGSEIFPVIFTHPQSTSTGIKTTYNASYIDPEKMYFTREFGDNVDDWNAHNSNSRTHRSWGEYPMLKQAVHYASPDYSFTCLENLYGSDFYHIGGTLWHAFDHQRGYHSQAFYGGIMDAYRQPKTSYYMFMSQRPAYKNPNIKAQTGAMVHIAHEMTPFSPEDVTVYSNCSQVRLTVFAGGKQYLYDRSSSALKMPSPIIVFKDVFKFMELKALSRAGRQNDVYMLAEGLIDGKVVAVHKVVPSRQPVKLQLRIDDDSTTLKADGSDVVTVIAELTDKDGVVKRLNNYSVKFTVEGEGRLLSDTTWSKNVVKVSWGSAPIMLQSTTKAGAIKIRAELSHKGINAIAPAEIIYKSVKSDMKFINGDDVNANNKAQNTLSSEKKSIADLIEENNMLKKVIADEELRKVENQQESFGEQR